jgi:uncharacterized protein (TIGR00369 family)
MTKISQPDEKMLNDSNSDVLSEWKKQDAAVRAVRTEPGFISLDDMKAYTGLEILQMIMAGKLPPPPMIDSVNFVLIDCGYGFAAFQGTPGKVHLNPLGNVNGGYSCTLLDSALACSVQTVLGKGMGYTTLELKVNLIRTLSIKNAPVRAEAKIIHVGSKIGTAEARLIDAYGTLYAHGTATCLTFPIDSVK